MESNYQRILKKFLTSKNGMCFLPYTILVKFFKFFKSSYQNSKSLLLGCEEWASQGNDERHVYCYCDDNDALACNDGLDEPKDIAGASVIKLCFGLISSILLYSLI